MDVLHTMWATNSGMLVTLAVVMLFVVALAIHEVMTFVRKRAGYTVRRLTLRMLMAGMLLFLLGSIMVGVLVFHLDALHNNLTLGSIFWSCVALLTGAIICLVAADLHALRHEDREHAKELWHDIAAILAEHEQQKTDHS